MQMMIIIQARTTSTRLPGKALLPVGGYPSAVLAALRGSNRNHPLVFATSEDASDDRLAAEAGKYGLQVFRGPLHDVLARYALAASSLPGDCIVVRLTADNVVPDGAFVSELAEAFVTSGAEYMGVDPQLSRTPYGVFAEAFFAAALRKANTSAVDPADREHVGPWMKRNCRAATFTPKLAPNENFGHLRSTIDTEEDYRQILRLFENVANPLREGWLNLTRRLAGLCDPPAVRVASR